MDSPIKKRRVDELANTTTATTTTAAHAAPVPPLLDLNQAVLDPFDQPDFGVPRYYRIPELAPEGERVYANNPPPPPHPTDEQSPVVDTLEYKGDIYLCQWMLDWIPLQDLWSFHQTTRQRTMDFRLLIKGKEDDSSMPAGLAALYKRKLIQEAEHPPRVFLAWAEVDLLVHKCFGCNTTDGLPKVRTGDIDVKMHYQPGKAGSVFIHGAERYRRSKLTQVEFEPLCYSLACRRSISVSLDVLRLSENWKGLKFLDMKQRRELVPLLQEVMTYIRKPTRDLEVAARKLCSHIIQNRVA